MDLDHLKKMQAVLNAADVPKKNRIMRATPFGVSKLNGCSMEAALKYCEEHGRCIDVVGQVYEFKIS